MLKNLKRFNKKYLLEIFLSWLFVLIWLMVIFFLSSMPSEESNLKSETTINKVIEKTLDKTNDIGLTNKHPSRKKIKDISESLNLPLRKVMHASVYLILALLLLNALNRTRVKNIKLYLLTLVICFLYALLDEYHQTFVYGRNGKLLDVLIDVVGAFIGIILYCSISKILILKKDQ